MASIEYEVEDQTEALTLTERLMEAGWDVNRKITTGTGIPLKVEIVANKDDGDADESIDFIQGLASAKVR